MDAADWREYRRRNADRLREYNRARRQQPKLRAQRHAAENRRRVRRRGELLDVSPLPAAHTGHQLFDAARAAVGPLRSRGAQLAFPEELDWEDAVSEAVLALLEGGDPVAAATAYLRRERGIRRVCGPLLVEVAA